MLVAPLIMDGPQACSRWARQPQPQLRHFKKPLVGPLPSPSSHSGRSEAPENSETSPREKGNLGLPVLLTDGSTHLEQIVGSERARCVATRGNLRSRVRSSTARRRPGCKDRRGQGRAKVTGADELFGTTRGCCVLPCLSYDSAATFSSSWSLAVGGRGGYILLCPFHFQADGTRGNTDALVVSGGGGGGLRQRFKKRTPTFTHNPSMLACGKLGARGLHRQYSGLSTK